MLKVLCGKLMRSFQMDKKKKKTFLFMIKQ
jgi:hypothetical protein